MRKYFCLVVAMLFTVTMVGQNYGILVNGNTYFAGELTSEFEGYTQYLAHVQVNAGDYCQLYDATNAQAWVVDLNNSSVAGFVRNGNRYDISVSGCYDFYIKLKYQADELYIGSGSNCGEGVPIAVPTSGFYLAGNGEAGKAWCCGLSWEADGCPIDTLTNTITYPNLPAGSYAFKITDGTWDHSWGYDAVSAACSTPGYYFNTDHNVLFNTDSAGSVTISFDGSNICLTVEHMAAPDTLSKCYYLAGNGEAGKAWCCGLNWDEDGCPLDSTGTITYPALPKGTYAFKITDGTWTNEWGFSEVSSACSTPGYTTDNDGNVCFQTSATGAVTIQFDGSNICLTVEKMYVDTMPHYGTAVPSQCTDVMLQAFYFDSFEEKAENPGTTTYHDTKWSTLLKQAGEIGAYFDLVWLPPSSQSSGGTGYHPLQYSNLSSAWGSKGDLVKFINAMHNQNTKVVADIVINHNGGKSGWCDYYTMNFTPYGIFEPDNTWITSDDEVWGKQGTGCTKGANAYPDDGYGSEANYEAARDWDHRNTQVQEMCRAYLKWMRNEVGFDGWRYDYCKGFWTGHINDYNTASDAYFSVMEYWDGNTQVLRSRLEDAGWNTLTFDFATKYEVFNNSMAGGNYSGCGAGMIGAGLSKYAVTFVDSHDSFLRDDNEFGGNGNSMSAGMRDKVLQANAYILSMPGVPCVFYPHWYTFKSQIKKMIEARHMTGVHSESSVTDVQKSAGGYQATITGKNGFIVLQLGDKVSSSIDGCTAHASGNGYKIWVHVNGDAAPGLIVTPGNTAFRDSVEGLTVSLKAVGGTCDEPVIYYTTDGTEPTTESASFTKNGTLTIRETTTLKAFALCGTARSKTQVYTYKYKEPQVGGITVRFLKPADWDHVFFFAWDGATQLLGGWPGTEIYQGADGWYSHTFDASITKFNFIINQGKNGAQSADLVAEYDVCYTWEGNNEMEIDCDDPITIDFDLAVSPADCIFRDNVNGLDVHFTAIGDPTAKIYYTTDGSEPNENSDSFDGEGEINITTTTTVKAFAKNDTERTATVVRHYTYREPQTTPLIVKFQGPAAWSKVYLYAWTNDGASTAILGGWPGKKWTEKDGKWYTYQFEPQYRSVNIIFNNGSNQQSSDILLEEDACYSWNADAADAIYDPNCQGTNIDVIRVENTNDDVYKVLIKDRLVIIRDGVMYDVLGHEL